MSKKQETLYTMLSLAVLSAVIVALSLWSRAAAEKAAREKQAQLQGDYITAMECMMQRDYKGALSFFASTESYKDTDALVLYAKAAAAYDAGNGRTYEKAHSYCEAFPSDYAGAYAAQMQALKKEVAAKKKRYDAEQAELAAEEEKRREREYRASLKTRLPYEGMSEIYIDSTFLGPHGDIAHNHETQNGKRYLCTLYRWYINGGRTCIFVARTLRGKVISVSKWNTSTAWDGNTLLGRIGGSPDDVPRAKPRAKPKADPYNASAYSHPEDFYYDYYDDFWEYEEAEEYWNEHS